MQLPRQTSNVRGCLGSAKSRMLRVNPPVASFTRWFEIVHLCPNAPPFWSEMRTRAAQLMGLGVVLMMSLMRSFRHASLKRANTPCDLLIVKSRRVVIPSSGDFDGEFHRYPAVFNPSPMLKSFGSGSSASVPSCMTGSSPSRRGSFATKSYDDTGTSGLPDVSTHAARFRAAVCPGQACVTNLKTPVRSDAVGTVTSWLVSF